MATYLLRRIPILLLTLVGILVVVFGIIHLAPGDATDALRAGGTRRVSPETIAAMKKLYHLDEPVWKQFVLWMGDLLRGDFGKSIQDGRPVIARIGEALPNTVTLNLVALFLTIGIAVPVGVLAAAKRGSRLDRWSGTGFFVLMSLPDFWIALLLVSFLSVKLRWFPLFGVAGDDAASLSFAGRVLDRLHHLALPVICLTITSLAYFSRLARASILDVIRQDYVRTARAKGLPERLVVFRHALRNALLPLVTLLGLMLPGLIGGSVIVERIFSWPGIGRLYFDAVLARDYPVVMALTLFTGALTLAGNLLADVLYGVVDPRVRRG